MRKLENTLKHMNGFEYIRILEKLIMYPTTPCNMRAKPMRAYVSIFLALLVFSHQLSADDLDKTPSNWQQKLETVIQVDISPLKPVEQKSIEDARAKVEALLQSAEPDIKQLASAYGSLGNLYLTHDL